MQVDILSWRQMATHGGRWLYMEADDYKWRLQREADGSKGRQIAPKEGRWLQREADGSNGRQIAPN